MAKTYSFLTLDDPVDVNFAAMQGIPSFTNLLGINNKDLIAGFYGSGNAGDPNQGFLLTLPGTYTPEDFPPSSQNPVTGNQVLQTQLTGLNDKGVVVGYFYNTNNGVPVDNQFGFFEKNGEQAGGHSMAHDVRHKKAHMIFVQAEDIVKVTADSATGPVMNGEASRRDFRQCLGKQALLDSPRQL